MSSSSKTSKDKNYEIHWGIILSVIAPVGFFWGVFLEPSWWVLPLSCGAISVVINEVLEYRRQKSLS